MNIAKTIFAKNKTFQDNVIRDPKVKVNMIQDYRETPRVPRKKGKKWMYQVQGLIKTNDGNRRVIANSKQKLPGFPVEDARAEAYVSFYERVSEAVLGEGNYDADEGFALVKDKNVIVGKIKEGIVTYEKRI